MTSDILANNQQSISEEFCLEDPYIASLKQNVHKYVSGV